MQTARLYLDAGFAVAIHDVIFPAEVREMFVTPLAEYKLHKVLLRPSLERAQSRNAHRTNKKLDTAGLVEIIGEIYDMMSPALYARASWTIIDSTHLSLEETVDAILNHI